jgi:hypothetical protein
MGKKQLEIGIVFLQRSKKAATNPCAAGHVARKPHRAIDQAGNSWLAEIFPANARDKRNRIRGSVATSFPDPLRVPRA